ncbi:antibiotic ABC transporter ATP-binding protein [candidate division KSB1 bacterium RBG_16_48_16]|nr:MAG: antibiotic ABC transporter ATP-binding protein [candidate division KSB1 bacterium RBG_16_48_16]
MLYGEEEILGKAYDSVLMRRLLRYLKPYLHQVIIAVCLLLFSAVFELIGPYLTKVAIDQYIAKNSIHGLTLIAALYLAALCLGFLSTYFVTYLTQWIGQHIMLDMRMQIFSHLQNLPLKFFDKNPVGRLVTRVTNDVESLNNMLSSGVVTIFGDVFLLLGIVVVMLNLHWQLALITFAVLPLIFYATFLFRSRVREAYRKVRIRIARINAYLQENISGMSTVQVFNRQKINFDKFADLNRDHQDAHIESIRYYAIFYPAIELISAISIALILWHGGMRVSGGTLTIGIMVAFIQYAQRFFQPIRDLSEKYNLLQSAMASSERIFKLLDSPEQIIVPENVLEMPPARGKIEFRDVSLSYNDKDFALKNVSFIIHPGEKVAVVGATGAGKSSLINLITKMYEPTSGDIFLDEVNINRLNVKDIRQRVKMVLQDVFIFSGTIEDNIRLSNKNIPVEKIIQAARDVNALSFIEKVPKKFQHELTERGSNLSVGQKQLLSFARALAFDPEILILDEATSSVDTETELLIRDATKKLMANRTSLIIAHRLSTIQNVDWIIALHKGQIREIGTHEELLARRGIYYRLYELQYADNSGKTFHDGVTVTRPEEVL